MEAREIQVLLVEDSPEERRLVRLELSEISEPVFLTHEASRLAEAEEELRKGRSDVVLLDLSLPDAAGLQGLIKLCQEYPTLPVVVFTGMDDQELALQALREGGQDFLVKGRTEPGVLKRVLLHAIERKRIDVALNNSRESLREAQRLETLGRLAGKIAHDFNNILTTIVGFSDLLLEDLQGHACVDDIMEIKKAGERGAALTSNILSFSRKEQPMLSSLDANEAVQGVSGMLRQLLPKNIDLALELQPELPNVLADLGQVEQALVNLVVNARDAMPGGGVIRVSTELRTYTTGATTPTAPSKPGDYVAIVVGDNGAGIDSATLDRIFEPFFTTKPKGAGTGLGLSTVISIVRGCGGGIEVKSAPGQGTSFYLSFPLFCPTGIASEINGHAPKVHVAASGLDVTLRPPRALEPLPEPFLKAMESGGEEWGMSQSRLAENLRHLYHVVGHDFHEPLRMVNSYLGLVKRRGRDQLGEDLVEFIDYAVDGSQRMQSMLDGVLRYSRSLKAPPTYEETVVSDVIGRVIREFPDTVKIRWEGDPPVLRVAPEHLATILRELISNALKFADPAAPDVVLRSHREDDSHWRLEVDDNGDGFPQDTAERCFRLFGRLHGRDEFPGLGVGLAVAHCLAEKYEAEISVSNLPGGGGRASLRWPVKEGAISV